MGFLGHTAADVGLKSDNSGWDTFLAHLEQLVKRHAVPGYGPNGLVSRVLVLVFHVIVFLGWRVERYPPVAVSCTLQPVPLLGCSCVSAGS